MREEIKKLIDFGASKIEYHQLVNNYHIKFIYNNKRYVIAHILNVYGESVDYWELDDKVFENLDDLLENLKSEV
jgi:hypothetical protein